MIGAIFAMIIVLLIALEYARLHSKYDWLFSNYATYYRFAPPSTSNIGPTRIVLSYERPWVSNLITTRPITSTGAEFLLKLIKTINIPAQYLINSADNNIPASVKNLNNFVVSKDTWNIQNNPLFTIGLIPYESNLVRGYQNQIGLTSGQGDLSLMILWLYGYEEYVRERFTWSATSVLDEWNYMFATDIPAQLPGNNPCDIGSIATNAISMGLGAAGVGAAVSGGNPFGALAGFVFGTVSSLLTKTKCL